MAHQDPIPAEVGRAKLAELLKRARVCMLTTTTADGRHVSRPMGLPEADFDGELWFFADAGSDKVAEIRTEPRVNVSVSDLRHHAWVSLSGTADVVDDPARAADLWHPFLKTWFPDGPSTPGLTLIRFRAESAEYWDSPGALVTTVIGFVTASIVGRRPDMAEHETVSLG